MLTLHKSPECEVVAEGGVDEITKDNMAFECSFKVLRKESMRYRVTWYTGEKLDEIHTEWLDGIDYNKKESASLIMTKSVYKETEIYKGVRSLICFRNE